VFTAIEVKATYRVVPSLTAFCCLYRAKSAKDRLDNHRVKYFLLDKNSPYTNTTSMLSTATSGKEDRRPADVPSRGADLVRDAHCSCV
jgi:hypothetical protein